MIYSCIWKTDTVEMNFVRRKKSELLVVEIQFGLNELFNMCDEEHTNI